MVGRTLIVTIISALFALLRASYAIAENRPSVHVVIEPTAEGAVAHYTFDKPLDAFRVSYPSDQIRDNTWKVLTPGIVRDGTLFASKDGASFGALDVEVRAWNETTDAIYPCLFRVGEHGIGFYAAYFIGDPSLFATTLEVAPAEGRIVEGFPLGGSSWRIDVAASEPGHRYVYVGRRGDVVESPYARFVLPPGPAPGMIKRIRANVDGMLGFYSRKLAHPLQTKALILLAANPTTRGSGFQGDTTDGPAVALRIFGDKWRAFDEKSDLTDHFIAHEGAHFWNARGDGAPAWMWEGVAEYLALEARMAVTKRLSRGQRRRHLERTLNDCVSNLLSQPFTGDRTSATYVCGQTIYWFADAGERRRSNGRGDIFSLWRRILDKAEENGGAYGPDHVLAIIAPDEPAKNTLGLFLAESGTERWQKLPALAAILGIKLQAGPPSTESLRHLALFHILNQYCTGSRGMWTQNDYLKLDTGDRCGPLNGDPDVDALNGHNLFTDMPAAYAAVTAACAANGEIAFTRAGKSDKVTATCTKPMPTAPPSFRIRATA